MSGWTGGRLALGLGICGVLGVHCAKPEAGGTDSEHAGKPVIQVSPPLDTAAPKISCTPTSFAVSADLAEASGAVILDAHRLLVVGDSGTRGSYVVLDRDSGATLEAGQLPLDPGASDDIEGLAMRNGELYGITSSGWIRRWKKTTSGYQLTHKSRSLGDPDYLCASSMASNCGQNYEGLCLAQTGEGGTNACVGFAAAKESGTLYCLTMDSTGQLSIDPRRSFKVASAKTLSGCAIDGDRLWFGRNGFAINKVGYIDHWRDAGTASIHRVGSAGVGFAEAIAASGHEIYRFSDTTGSPSLLSKYNCR